MPPTTVQVLGRRWGWALHVWVSAQKVRFLQNCNVTRQAGPHLHPGKGRQAGTGMADSSGEGTGSKKQAEAKQAGSTAPASPTKNCVHKGVAGRDSSSQNQHHVKFRTSKNSTSHIPPASSRSGMLCTGRQDQQGRSGWQAPCIWEHTACLAGITRHDLHSKYYNSICCRWSQPHSNISTHNHQQSSSNAEPGKVGVGRNHCMALNGHGAEATTQSHHFHHGGKVVGSPPIKVAPSAYQGAGRSVLGSLPGTIPTTTITPPALQRS